MRHPKTRHLWNCRWSWGCGWTEIEGQLMDKESLGREGLRRQGILCPSAGYGASTPTAEGTYSCSPLTWSELADSWGFLRAHGQHPLLWGQHPSVRSTAPLQSSRRSKSGCLLCGWSWKWPVHTESVCEQRVSYGAIREIQFHSQ